MEPVIIHTYSVHSGMMDKIEPWYLPNTSAAYLQNLDISRPGSRKRRLGASSNGGNSQLPGGLFRSVHIGNYPSNPDQPFETLWTIYGGEVYLNQPTGYVSKRASGISLTDALHQASEGRWNLRTCIYITQAQSHDSTVSRASGVLVLSDIVQYSQTASMAPNCATWFQHRLWCAGNVLAENDETLWWSELDDGLSYSLTNTIQVEPGTGGPITGLVALRGASPALLVFKRRATCLFAPTWGSSAQIPSAGDALDTTTSNLIVLANNVGCCAARSIQFTPGSEAGDIIFLSWEGFRSIRRTDQDVVSGVTPPISDQILSTIQRINFSYAHKATSCVEGHYYHCAVPLDGATENTHVLSYDLIARSWFVNTWAAKDLVISTMGDTSARMWMQYNEQTGECSITGLFTGYHIFKCFDGFLDPGGAGVQFREDTRGILPTNNIQDKHAWNWVGLTVKNEAGATSAMTIYYNIDQAGWVTAGSLCIASTLTTIVLGVTPLPWEPNTARIQTSYLSLADAPPGFEIQIRYVSEDEFAIPSVLDVSVKASPIGPEIDNTIG